MSDSDRPVVRMFNPGMLQGDDEVIRQFVVRDNELQVLLGVLRGNISSPSCQHALVVAPRGRGKTMLLARVAAEMRKPDNDLSRAFVPVRLMEESYEVFSLGDFWLEVLFHLAMEVESQHPDLSVELKKSHVDLAGRWQGPEWEEQTCAAVLEAADLLGRKLVLMVENMQDMCEQADRHFGWKLRKVMQTEPNVVLIASATSRFEALDVSEPFFDIFRTLNLEPLNRGECALLWQVLTGESVGERQVQPLRILTGGSPRLIAVVADSRRSLADLMENLADLVDEHTEYFRSQFGALTGQKRRVYTALVDLWQPSSASEVARRSRLDIRGVSTMLGRLVDDGVVEIVDNGTRGRYRVVERLTCIYYKMRQQRDGAAVVRRLVAFMRAFYSPEWVASWLGEFLHDPTPPTSVRAEALRSRITAMAGLEGDDQWNEFLARPGALDEVREIVMRDAASPETFDVAVYDRVFKQGGMRGRSERRRAVAVAALHGMAIPAIQKPTKDILTACNSVEGILHDRSFREHYGDKLMLAGTRAITLFGLGKERAAMDQVAALYDAFRPENNIVVLTLLEQRMVVELMLEQLMSIVPIAAVRASNQDQQEIVEILSSDNAKAAMLQPMIVALRIRLGETVRAPADVLDVANDILEELEQREHNCRVFDAMRMQSSAKGQGDGVLS